MNSSVKLSITILLSATLISSFITISYIPPVTALTTGDISFDDLAGLPGIDLIKGPKGDKGDPGPQGPPGPDKALEVITVSNTETIQRDEEDDEVIFVSSIVECPTGTKVTGGGYKHPGSGGSERISVFENVPFNNGWKATAQGTGTDSIELTVYATCSQLVDSPPQ